MSLKLENMALKDELAKIKHKSAKYEKFYQREKEKKYRNCGSQAKAGAIDEGTSSQVGTDLSMLTQSEN